MASPLDDQQIYRQRRAFGLLLAALRRDLHLSQNGVAQRANLTIQRVSRLERGHVIPVPTEVAALTSALAEAMRALAAGTPPPVRVIGRGVPAARGGASRPAVSEAVHG